MSWVSSDAWIAKVRGKQCCFASCTEKSVHSKWTCERDWHSFGCPLSVESQCPSKTQHNRGSSGGAARLVKWIPKTSRAHWWRGRGRGSFRMASIFFVKLCSLKALGAKRRCCSKKYPWCRKETSLSGVYILTVQQRLLCCYFCARAHACP